MRLRARRRTGPCSLSTITSGQVSPPAQPSEARQFNQPQRSSTKQGDSQMAKKPTAADAQLLLQLYDLRREAEMRKARNWWVVTFWPRTADEFIKVATALGTQENNWLRQAGGYWDLAAALVLHATIH